MAKPVAFVRQRVVVHESHHQDFVRVGVLNDGRNESIELRKVHAGTSLPAELWRVNKPRQEPAGLLRVCALKIRGYAQLHRPVEMTVVMVEMRVVEPEHREKMLSQRFAAPKPPHQIRREVLEPVDNPLGRAEDRSR